MNPLTYQLWITSYLQTESEIEEKTTKQLWFLDCYQCFIDLRFWVEPLCCTRRSPSVLPNTPSWNRIAGLVSKWRLPLRFTVEIYWFYIKKLVKWPYKPVFYTLMCFSIYNKKIDLSGHFKVIDSYLQYLIPLLLMLQK